MNNATGLRSLSWAAASFVATIAVVIMLLVVIGPPPVSAETPAERCKRETTAYNNAWKNTWAQANPGKSPSQAPQPLVPYKCRGGNDGPPPSPPPSPSSAAPDPTTEPEKPAPTRGEGPSLNPTTQREEPASGVDQNQSRIGDRDGARSPSSATRKAPAETPRTRSSSDTSPASPLPRPREQQISSPLNSQPTKRPDHANYAAGNNDTDDSACVGVPFTEQRIGSNCHHYREVVTRVTSDIKTDFSDQAGACSYDEHSNPCTLSHSTERGVTIGFTGGLSGEFVKAELSVTSSDIVTVEVVCGAPKNPDSAKGTVAYMSNYNPTYYIDKYYVTGGGLAERSDQQSAKEGRGVHCVTVLKEA
ncbi:hypothetical protein GCM10023217_12380 [Gordonia alkaliphila]|uniref:Uncharacterized protein n=1 Tax=Gordonia alkaliphila TaxID=1053547 RepID=A0ABP8Z2Q8_9ACTN